MPRRPPLEHRPELLRRPWQSSPVPQSRSRRAADQVEHRELAGAVARGDLLGVLREPPRARAADRARARPRWPRRRPRTPPARVDPHHHAVVEARRARPTRSRRRRPRRRAPDRAPAGRRSRRRPPRAARTRRRRHRHVGEQRRRGSARPRAPVEPDAVRVRRQAALDTPRDRALAVAAVGHDGAARPRSARRPFRRRSRRGTARARQSRSGSRARGEHGREPLLALERLHGEPDAEHRRRSRSRRPCRCARPSRRPSSRTT